MSKIAYNGMDLIPPNLPKLQTGIKELERTFTLSQVTAIFDGLEKLQRYDILFGDGDRKGILVSDILALRKHILGE